MAKYIVKRVLTMKFEETLHIKEDTDEEALIRAQSPLNAVDLRYHRPYLTNVHVTSIERDDGTIIHEEERNDEG